MIMQSFHRQLRLLTCLVCVGFALPIAALARTTAPAPLPPAAQAALKKGIIAAKEQEWMIAIQCFQDARKAAPTAPELFYNLGLAESKIPGRELRAIAWFGAYLTADPNASNAAAVNDFIAGLQIKNHGNINRLIKTAQDSASQTGKQQFHLADVALLWMEAGDLAAALTTADLNHAATDINSDDVAVNKSRALSNIAKAQANFGDIAGARKTFASALQITELIQYAYNKSDRQDEIATLQARAGDIAGAQKTAALINYSAFSDSEKAKSDLQENIAEAQMKSGDIAGAKETFDVWMKIANSIHDADPKCSALMHIVEAQATLGDIAGAKATLALALKAYNSIENKEFKTLTAGLFPTLYSGIAHAQLKAGDIAGARESLELLIKYADPTRDPDNKYNKYMEQFSIRSVREAIDDAQLKAGSVNKSAATVSPTTVALAPIAVINVSDWVNNLDDKVAQPAQYSVCPLNTEPFLDLAGYLTGQHSDDPDKLFDVLKETAEKIIKAQNVIDKMLKQQAKQ